MFSAHLPSTPPPHRFSSHPGLSLPIIDVIQPQIVPPAWGAPWKSSSLCLLNFKDSFQKIYLVAIKMGMCLQALFHIHSQEYGTSPSSICVQGRRASDLKLGENLQALTCYYWKAALGVWPGQLFKAGWCRHSAFSLPGQGTLDLSTHTERHMCHLGLKAATGTSTRPTTFACCQPAFIPIALPPNKELLAVKTHPNPVFLGFTQAVSTIWSWSIPSLIWLYLLNYQHSECLK